MARKFADTPAKRFFKLGSMSARVAGKYTGNRLKTLFADDDARRQSQAALYDEIGEQVAETLGQLKGAAMKVGQIASQLQHVLPEEFTRQIARLQQQSPPMDYAVIARQIQCELGFLPEQLFARFEPAPFAAASIGQVHRAITRDGREVVVKVQYPGVYRSCQSDLVQLKRLFSLSGLLKMDKAVMDSLFADIEANLMAELDYRQEAANLKHFRAFHAGFPDIVIPEVIEDYCSGAVLCLAYEPGDSFASLQDKGYSQQQINRCAINLVAAILREVLYNNRAHCDPHPGNFAFRPDGSVVIYDYGAVTDVEDWVIDHYIDILQAAIEQRFDAIDAKLLALGVRNPEVEALPVEWYRQLYVDFIAPALQETCLDTLLAEAQPKIRQQMPQWFALRAAFQPNAATMFLNRVIGGHLLNLAQLGVDADLKPVILSHVFDEEPADE